MLASQLSRSGAVSRLRAAQLQTLRELSAQRVGAGHQVLGLREESDTLLEEEEGEEEWGGGGGRGGGVERWEEWGRRRRGEEEEE